MEKPVIEQSGSQIRRARIANLLDKVRRFGTIFFGDMGKNVASYDPNTDFSNSWRPITLAHCAEKEPPSKEMDDNE